MEDADEDDDFGSDRDIGSNKKKKNKKQVDEDDEFNQFNDDNDDMSFDEDMGEPEDNENAVFNLAKENNEMHDPNSLNTKKPATSYTNQEMVSKIEKLEDQMVSGKDPVSKKGWQL